MSSVLFDSISRIARHEANARAVAGIGRVVDVFTAGDGQKDHAVSVEMRASGLVLPRVPIAVGVMGFAAIPTLDDLVVVVFANGDFNAPVVVGRLYHPDLDPPAHANDEIVLRLPAGEAEPKLNLTITSETPTFQLTLPGDVQLQLVEEEIKLAVGEVSATLTAAGGGTR